MTNIDEDRVMTPEEFKQDTMERLRNFVVTKLKKPEGVATLHITPGFGDEQWMDGSFVWKFGVVSVEIAFNVSSTKNIAYAYVFILTEGRSLPIGDLPPEFMEQVHGWIYEVVDEENTGGTAALIRSNLALEWILL